MRTPPFDGFPTGASILIGRIAPPLAIYPPSLAPALYTLLIPKISPGVGNRSFRTLPPPFAIACISPDARSDFACKALLIIVRPIVNSAFGAGPYTILRLFAIIINRHEIFVENFTLDLYLRATPWNKITDLACESTPYVFNLVNDVTTHVFDLVYDISADIFNLIDDVTADVLDLFEKISEREVFLFLEDCKGNDDEHDDD